MGTKAQQTIHATAILLDGRGVMIRGASGSGKSRLALALLETAGCQALPDAGEPTASPNALVGDDWLVLSHDEDQRVASPGPNLAGLIEVRGIGILGLPWQQAAAIRLLVDLKPADEIERLPETQSQELDGLSLPSIAVPTGDLAHQCLLVRTALRVLAC